MSIQPYFVMDTDNFCQRILLQNGISHFYSFSNSSSTDVIIKLLVDGCSNIIFEYNNENHSLRSHFIGSTIEPRTFCIRKNCSYFCVRLQPAAATKFIKEIDVKDSIGKIIIIDTLPSVKDVCAAMKEEKDFDSRVQTFLDCYAMAQETGENQSKSGLFKQIADIIVNRRGMVKISELEKLSGYTSRYINNIFDKELGFSAKQLCTSVKFQFLLNDLNNSEGNSLTKLSSEYNFYDQSHFIHEFKNCTGTTPSEYADQVAGKKYSHSIQNI